MFSRFYLILSVDDQKNKKKEEKKKLKIVLEKKRNFEGETKKGPNIIKIHHQHINERVKEKYLHTSSGSYLRFRKLTLVVKLLLKLAKDRVPACCSYCIYFFGLEKFNSISYDERGKKRESHRDVEKRDALGLKGFQKRGKIF